MPMSGPARMLVFSVSNFSPFLFKGSIFPDPSTTMMNDVRVSEREKRKSSSLNRIRTDVDVIVFFWFMLPEMKNRSLEELDELFQNRVSVRDFKKYQCISSERAKELAHTDIIGDSKRAGSAAVETVEDTDAAHKV